MPMPCFHKISMMWVFNIIYPLMLFFIVNQLLFVCDAFANLIPRNSCFIGGSSPLKISSTTPEHLCLSTVRSRSLINADDLSLIHRRNDRCQIRMLNGNTEQDAQAVTQMKSQVDFWQQQKELVSSMKEKESKSKKEISRIKYEKRAAGLLVDTMYIGFYIFCSLWLCVSNPFVAFSYELGALCGVAYAYGLSKYVQSVGGTIDDAAEDISGSGFGAARFAFLIVLFVAVGKFRTVGLLEIPSILGFFTYQLASLSQGLRDIND